MQWVFFLILLAGVYKCVAENREGEVESKSVRLEYLGSEGAPVFLITPNSEQVRTRATF